MEASVDVSTEAPGGADHEESEEQVTPQTEESIEASSAEEEPVKEPEAEELEAMRAELEQTQAQAAEYLDGWQRARAEFANYKKRVEAERGELRQSSNEALLLKMLPVVDDFERAFQALPEDLEDIVWADGFAMIQRKLQSILESENVTPLEATGQPFDPEWHQAVLQEETSEYPDGYVSEEMQRGYLLGRRVLRPSMVKVAINHEKEIGDEEEVAGDE
jgi:molecular chaperone GrpE